jgi:hypothetical protein
MDRLEHIAARRGADPDVAWLIREVIRLRQQLEVEHEIALDLAGIALRKLDEMREDVEALTSEVAVEAW